MFSQKIDRQIKMQPIVEMHIEKGLAFVPSPGDIPPTFLVVSIYDKYPPGDEWTHGTSLASFSTLVGLDQPQGNASRQENFDTITNAWNAMREDVKRMGYGLVQDYYKYHPSPEPVFRMVTLKINWTKNNTCRVMLTHAPDFNSGMPYDKAMSLLSRIYRIINGMCAYRGGDRATARMAPLSAGKFATRNSWSPILGCCVNELFTPWSAPITVYAYDEREYKRLLAAESDRAIAIGLSVRTP